MTDFIIVGRGLAATVLMHTFQQNQVSFKVIGNKELSTSSRVAAGIWNPVVFKRLTKSWMADNLIPYLETFYLDCQTRLGEQFVFSRNILKPFSEEQERRLWLQKSNNELDDYLDVNEAGDSKTVSGMHWPMGYGIVKKAGNIDVPLFLERSALYFSDHIENEVFDHLALEIKDGACSYKGKKARHIVFCEGHLMKHNPFFQWIKLKPAKGEVLTIRANNLMEQNHILNKGAYLVPAANGEYKLGASYEWQELNDQITEKARRVLESKLQGMYHGTYEILRQEAGVRPASGDRRPIIGPHPLHKNMHVFNGLGTKGVMLAPYFAKNFVNFYLQKEALHPEVNISRYYHCYA